MWHSPIRCPYRKAGVVSLVPHGYFLSWGFCLGQTCLLLGLVGHSPIAFLFHLLVSFLGWFGLFQPWASGPYLQKWVLISVNMVFFFFKEFIYES